MNEIFAAASEVQEFLQNKEWSFCIIGGLALARWGQPRATADVDITLLTAFATEEPFIDGFLDKFTARRRGSTLNWGQIVDELTPLCELKESPELVQKLLAMRDQIE